jgi:hypothetical protein
MNPDLVNWIKRQDIKNLNKLSMEYMHTWNHETILLLMVEEAKAESPDIEQTVESILSQFGLKNLHMVPGYINWDSITAHTRKATMWMVTRNLIL